MAKLKDVLKYVSYGVSLDIVDNYGRGNIVHLFPVSDFVTREIIESNYPQLLERRLWGGIHAEGPREGCLLIPLKPLR